MSPARLGVAYEWAMAILALAVVPALILATIATALFEDRAETDSASIEARLDRLEGEVDGLRAMLEERSSGGRGGRPPSHR